MRNDLLKNLLTGSKLGYDNMVVDFVKQVVCSYYEVEHRTMMEATRERSAVKCRQVAIYLINKHTSCTLTFIGMAFKKTHATIIHSKKTVEDNMFWDKDLKREVEELDKVITLKANAIATNYNLEDNFYFVDMNGFVSYKINNKTIILVDFTDDERKEFENKNDLKDQRNHINKGMYILEKNEKDKNKS